MGKRWIQEEIDFLKTNYLLMTDKRISIYLKGRTEDAVRTKRNILGLPKPILKSGQAAMHQRYSEYKNRASRKGLDWELTTEEFHLLCQQSCFYCDAKPAQIVRVRKCNGIYVYNGIDRLDNSKGYRAGNIVTCCGVCNRAKGQLTYNQFYEWASRLHNNFVSP